MLPYHSHQNQFLIDHVNAANASVSPFAIHIPICTASHVPLHHIASSSQPRTWSFGPCHSHGNMSQHLTIQPCCTTPHAVTQQLMATSSHLYQPQQPSHHILPPPPPYGMQRLASQQHHHHQTPMPHSHDPYQQHYHHFRHLQQTHLNSQQQQQQQPQQQTQSAQQHILSQQLAASAALMSSSSVVPSRLPGVNSMTREELLTDSRQLSFLHVPPSAAYASSNNNAARQSVGRLAPSLGVHSLSPPAGLPQSHPVLFADPNVGHSMAPSTQDYSGSLPRYRRASANRRRWQAVPPPPYPGFLLHVLSAVGRPPVATQRVHILHMNEEDELDSYEALINLAERLGDAKPRGLTREVIDRLPCYRFNAELRRPPSSEIGDECEGVKSSSVLQTSCVVCLGDFESRQLLRSLPCRHEFHARCVDKWLKVNRSCPICRSDTLDYLKMESSA